MNKTLHTKWGNARVNNYGYYIITTSKEGYGNKPLHRLIYEEFYGEIPKGFDIHHKNENKQDNCILNLQIIRHDLHPKLHKGEKRTIETRRKISEKLTGRKLSKEHIEKLKAAQLNKQGKDSPRWGTSIIDEWGGIWFLKEMKKQVGTMKKLTEYTGLKKETVRGYLRRRGFNWSTLTED